MVEVTVLIQEVVNTKYGAVRGAVGKHEGVRVFKGIPYAQSPVGPLRWMRPQPPKPWSGIKDALEYGNRCWQFMRLPGQNGNFFQKEFTFRTLRPSAPRPESEDCLYINIWTAAEDQNAKQPVLFYIHGGAFCNGSGADIWLEQENFCRKGVVVVSFNYRVGVLGFLAHPVLADEEGHFGNYGMHDQIAALHWVKENIGAFGGDPERIVLMGNSAGGKSCEILNCSSLTEGAYQGAILESSGGVELPLEAAVEEAEKFISLLGVKDADQLRDLPIEKIMDAYETSNHTINKEQKHIWVPTIDGYVLENYCKTITESGKMHNVDYLCGVAKDDMDIPEMFQMGERWAKAQAEPGKEPVYFYYFDRRMPGDDPVSFAYHGVDNWYQFDMVSENWRDLTPEDYQLSQVMQQYFVNFISDGNPNGEGLPVWEAYTKENPGILRMGLSLHMDKHIDPREGEECPKVPWVKSDYH